MTVHVGSAPTLAPMSATQKPDFCTPPRIPVAATARSGRPRRRLLVEQLDAAGGNLLHHLLRHPAPWLRFFALLVADNLDIGPSRVMMRRVPLHRCRSIPAKHCGEYGRGGCQRAGCLHRGSLRLGSPGCPRVAGQEMRCGHCSRRRPIGSL